MQAEAQFVSVNSTWCEKPYWTPESYNMSSSNVNTNGHRSDPHFHHDIDTRSTKLLNVEESEIKIFDKERHVTIEYHNGGYGPLDPNGYLTPWIPMGIWGSRVKYRKDDTVACRNGQPMMYNSYDPMLYSNSGPYAGSIAGHTVYFDELISNEVYIEVLGRADSNC